jgi:hypothetical protein
MLNEAASGMNRAINSNNGKEVSKPKNTDIVNSGLIGHNLNDEEKVAHSKYMKTNHSVETNYDGKFVSYSGSNSNVISGKKYHKEKFKQE